MQEEYGRKQIARLDLAGGEAVLDIGCGDGRLTAEIARRVPRGRVLGIDSSPEMIAAAREAHAALHPTLSFELVDATAMPFREEFDLVFSTSALHWIKDHHAVLEGIRSALKPRGRIYLTFAARGSISEFAQVLTALARDSRWAPQFQGYVTPYAFYSMEEYRAWLDQLGFEVERLQMIERDVSHQGKEGFQGWIRTTGMPYLNRVEPEKRTEFITALVDSYIEKHPLDAQGRIHVKMFNLLVQGRKGTTKNQ